MAAVRSTDNVMTTQDGCTGTESISRYAIRRIQTPQSYRLDYLERIHREAIEKGIVHCMDNNSLLARMGETVWFSKGSDFNIKINAVEDVEMFKALYRMV